MIVEKKLELATEKQMNMVLKPLPVLAAMHGEVRKFIASMAFNRVDLSIFKQQYFKCTRKFRNVKQSFD